MLLPSNIQPWLQRNAHAFSELSHHAKADNDGVVLQLPPKPIIQSVNQGFSEKKRSHGWITSVVGGIGERVIHTLLPYAEHTWDESASDILMPSASTNETVFVEVKTAQTRNRGVIRTSQVNRYQERADNTHVYYAQVFYEMRNGRLPSEFHRGNIEANFLPLCIYIFPISFIIYLINTIHPTGQKESTQFYGLTRFRAQSIFNMLHTQGLFTDDVIGKYRARVFTTVHLPQNPEAQLYIVDHAATPHILGYMN